MTMVWGLIAGLALLWPDRVRGPFDGVPLDGTLEAILIGVVFPALCCWHSGFLITRLARTCSVALLAWKICASAFLVQSGWCVQFQPARPFAKDAKGAPHAWDLRADWLTASPTCSAIMTRSYDELRDFPASFFNLPPDNDSWPAPQDRPPGAITAMRVRGYLEARAPGVLQIDTGPDVQATVALDGESLRGPVAVAAGVHAVNIDATLTGDRWQLVPRWNGGDFWASVGTTVRRPPPFDRYLRQWLAWIPFFLVSVLLIAWTGSAIALVGDAGVLAWTAIASVTIGGLVATDHVEVARWSIAALAGAALVPVPQRLRGLSGACIMIGVPWLTFVVMCSAPAIGRWVLYDVGSDFWMYQRFAYRIVMQGYWLEGGSPTFWFQAFYRWIVGVLHVVFGDSSVGEWYWDGACLLAGALFSFRIARTFAGFRWGLVAAAAPLAVFVLGTAQTLIGRGLSEISSSGLLSLAALYAIRSRHRGMPAAVAAGLLATVAFLTRMNNLPMAFGIAIFAVPLHVPVRAVLRPHAWWRRVSLRTGAVIPVAIGIGLLLFAWRTWHYTGVFSVFYGTQRDLLTLWQPGLPLGTVLRSIGDNLLMVLTVNDPPRFDPYALPVLAGAAFAGLSVVGLPRLRDLPATATFFFFASIAGAFIARGSAYPGRFSVHVLPVTCTLAVCGLASLCRARHTENDA